MDIRPKDFFGNTIKVGDCIVYPGRQGSSMWMNKGTVMAIGQKGDPYAPVLQVKKVQTTWDGRPVGYRDVEILILDRVICLGRGYGYKCNWTPRKSKDIPTIFNETWLDRLMNWFRR